MNLFDLARINIDISSELIWIMILIDGYDR